MNVVHDLDCRTADKEMHLFGGDILLNEKQNRLLHRDAALPTRARHARAVVKLRARKWEAGEVPYELSSDFSKYIRAPL